MLHALTVLLAAISAGEWTTSDGVVTVAVPNESRFILGEVEPPLSVVWVTDDETVKLGVAETPFPKNATLVKSAVEEGLAEELGGEIVASSTSQVDGHEVFTMTAHTHSPGVDLYITQSVFAFDGKAYKLMAVGLGQDIRTDPDVAEFLGSLKLPPAAPRETSDATASRSGPANGEESEISQADLWSRRIGGISVLVLLGCVAALLVRYFARRRSRATGPPSVGSAEASSATRTPDSPNA